MIKIPVTRYIVIYCNNINYIQVSNGKGSLKNFGVMDQKTVKRLIKWIKHFTGLDAYKGYFKGAYVYSFGEFKSLIVFK
jgi:hypothetical protein